MIMDLFGKNNARGCRALLALITESRFEDMHHRLIEIGILIDDDRVFAAHLTDHPLHVLLFRLVVISGPQDF